MSGYGRQYLKDFVEKTGDLEAIKALHDAYAELDMKPDVAPPGASVKRPYGDVDAPLLAKGETPRSYVVGEMPPKPEIGESLTAMLNKEFRTPRSYDVGPATCTSTIGEMAEMDAMRSVLAIIQSRPRSEHVPIIAWVSEKLAAAWRAAAAREKA